MSTHTALLEIQTAVIQTLRGDAQLMAMVTKVCDFGAVPDRQLFPYVAMGDPTESPDNTFGRRGYDDTFTLHIWSDFKGFEECYSILARMNDLLDQPTQPLALATHHHVGTWFEYAAPINDPGEDGIRHMPVRYRFGTQE